MAHYSDAEIDELITCPKTVSSPPARALKLIGADWRNNAEFASADGRAGTFSVFMRKNDDLPENFSVGLIYRPVDGRPEITLPRCNGKHGTFTGQGDVAHPHWVFHIHKASELAQDRGLTAEKYASATSAFASYEEALQYFLRAVNLNERDEKQYFPGQAQGKLFVN